MEFQKFKKVHQQHMARMLNEQSCLFVTDTDKDEMWELYLDSFPPGTNEVYRERRAHDCSCCRAFVKQFGNVVVLVNNEPVTIWDVETGDDYQHVVDALAECVKSRSVRDLFVTKESAFGTDKNHERLEDGAVHTWHHFRVELPRRFVSSSHKTVGSLMAEARASKEVFRRSLEEIAPDAVETVLDLIAEGSLYRGEEWRGALVKFSQLQNEYRALPTDQRDNFCWSKSVEIGGAISRIRNHSIGVLLQDITDSVDVLEAVRRYEHIVAPQNYKRPKPVFTRKMVEAAQAAVERLGLTDSLPRRFARMDDITVNNVIWANRDAVREMSGLGIFDELAREVAVDPRKFEHVQGVGIGTFINDILPGAVSIEVLLENKHEGSFVSLIAPQNRNAPSLFKWDNGFSWAYNGNVADSMKARVKALGGDVTGVLRFSIQWNEGGNNSDDFDAHCVEPNGNHIFFQNKGRRHRSSGMLDVDIMNPRQDIGNKTAVENITWSDKREMPDGVYRLFVRNFAHRGGRSGFRAEIEFDGRCYEYDYPRELGQKEDVTVAKVQLVDGQFKLIESLPTTTSAREVWGLTTNQFQPVSVVTYSPNYWDGESGIGNRHHFFMLAGCQNPECPNGFYNEYLREEFMEQKRVFAALGSKMRVEQTETQLSGLGFSLTKRNNLIVRVDGQMIIKVIF